MSSVKAGDQIEDENGDVWTVTEVISGPNDKQYVEIERLVPTTRTIKADLIGQHAHRYRPVRQDGEGS